MQHPTVERAVTRPAGGVSRRGRETDELDVIALLLEVRLNRQLGRPRDAARRLLEAWVLLDQVVDQC